MTPALGAAIAGALFLGLGGWAALSWRRRPDRRDTFPNLAAELVALALLAVVLGLLALSAMAGAFMPAEIDTAKLSYGALFHVHAILAVFLGAWWLLSGRPPLTRFLGLPRTEIPKWTGVGVAVGLGGWLVTILVAIAAFVVLTFVFEMPVEDLEPSPIIAWIAGLPLALKLAVLASAMTVEEVFFRAFLQARFGIAFSTVCFTLAHLSYGQPFMLVGIVTISLVLGAAFTLTRNLLPCIVAHGVFDAIQLLVVLPILLRSGT